MLCVRVARLIDGASSGRSRLTTTEYVSAAGGKFRSVVEIQHVLAPPQKQLGGSVSGAAGSGRRLFLVRAGGGLLYGLPKMWTVCGGRAVGDGLPLQLL